MLLGRSRVSALGQISVPVLVRRKLGIEPDSVLEWNEEDGKIVVRRLPRFSSEDIHRLLFPDHPPATRTVDEMKQGTKQHAQKRYGRGR